MASAAWARARSWGAFCPRTSANKCQYLTETVPSGEPFCSRTVEAARASESVVGQFRRGPTRSTFTFTLNSQPGKTHTHLLLTPALTTHQALCTRYPPALITPKLTVTPPSRRVRLRCPRSTQVQENSLTCHAQYYSTRSHVTDGAGATRHFSSAFSWGSPQSSSLTSASWLRTRGQGLMWMKASGAPFSCERR